MGKVLSALKINDVDQLDHLLDLLLEKVTLTRDEVGKFASIAVKAGNIVITSYSIHYTKLYDPETIRDFSCLSQLNPCWIRLHFSGWKPPFIIELNCYMF